MFLEFEPVLSLSVIASKWCLLQGTQLREYLSGYQLLIGGEG